MKTNKKNKHENSLSWWNSLPAEIVQKIKEHAPEIMLPLSSTSHYNMSIFESARKEMIQLIYLRKMLRLEEIMVPTELHSYFVLNANTFQPNINKFFQLYKENINTQLTAYSDYFQEYIAHIERKMSPSYNCTQENKHLDTIYKHIKTLEKTTPSQLIVDTSIRVLHAKVKYLHTYYGMETTTEMDYCVLDELAIKGIGIAQLKAGEQVWDRYFCGDDMKQASIKESCSWAKHLKIFLGTKFFLPIAGPRLNDMVLSVQLPYAHNTWHQCLPHSGLPLISVIKEYCCSNYSRNFTNTPNSIFALK